MSLFAEWLRSCRASKMSLRDRQTSRKWSQSSLQPWYRFTMIIDLIKLFVVSIRLIDPALTVPKDWFHNKGGAGHE